MQACCAPLWGEGGAGIKWCPLLVGPEAAHQAAVEWFPLRAGGAGMLERLGTCSFPSKLRPQTVSES